MTTQERILAVIRKVSNQAAPPDTEESLFDSGYLDSFALTDMVGEIEKEFGIRIPDSDLNPRKFESVAKIQSYIEKHSN